MMNYEIYGEGAAEVSLKQRLQNALNTIFPAQRRKVEEAEQMRSKTANSMWIKHKDLSKCEQERNMQNKAYSSMINIGKREVEDHHANH